MEGLLERGRALEKGTDGYDGHMDPECIAICDALNALPDVETTESCCGHLKDCYRIFFKTVNPYSLGIIARVFDRRYSETNIVYDVKLLTKDSGSCPNYDYMIESVESYSSQKDMDEDIQKILDNIKYWQNPRYDEYFGKDVYNKNV